jgi:hypothetical protein
MSPHTKNIVITWDDVDSPAKYEDESSGAWTAAINVA